MLKLVPVPLVVLTLFGCGLDGRPQSRPWFAEIVDAGDVFVVASRYDSRDVLHLLGVRSNGELLHATLDDRTRAIDWGSPVTFEVDGVPYDPYATQTDLLFSRFDLAIRPGSDEVWLWLDGLAGPLSGGTVEVALQHPADARVYRGGLAFESADTVLLSKQGGADEVVRVPVGGGTAETLYDEGLDYAVPAFCQADVANGLLYHFDCDGQNGVRIYDLAAGSNVVQAVEEDDDISRNPPAMTGVADGWVLGLGLTTELCMGSLAEDGRSEVSTKKYLYEGNCWGVDASIGPFSGGDVRGDGDQFMVFYANGLVVMFDRSAPKTADNDLSGTWCDGGVRRLQLPKGGAPVFPDGSSDALLFDDISWKAARDVLTFRYDGLTPANFAWDGPVDVKHWAVRAGDTLHIKTYTHEKYGVDGAGLAVLTGIYLPCD
ncbi:MAG: hypothetical protein R3F61_14515 [Myxococcota bacterium]